MNVCVCVLSTLQNSGDHFAYHCKLLTDFANN